MDPDESNREWHKIETPFSQTLYEVVNTAKGPYAVGDGGIVAANRTDSEEHDWEIMLEGGPKTKDNRLKGLGVTDDGKRIWFAGSSGSLGCYDVVNRRKYDYSDPHQMTSTWEGLAVCGETGKEKGLVANGSGEILGFRIDGFDVDWGVVRKPANKGASVAAMAASPEGVGYAIDTNGNAFRTTEDDGWRDIGILNAQVKFHDIWAGENQRVYVAASDGRVYRYDDSYHNWTPIQVAEETLQSFDLYDDEMVVMGNSGTIYQRVGKDRWEEVHSPVESNLFDIALGNPDAAVGTSGIVIQRPRDYAHDSPKVTSADDDQYEGRGENYDYDDNEPQSFDGENEDKYAKDDSEDGSTGDSSSSEDGSTTDGSST